MRRTAMCAAFALASLLPGQTREEVREALQSYFGPEDVKKNARARLRTWDEKALPHLRAIAGTAGGEKLAWALVCALCKIRSRKATELWVQIISGKTEIDPMLARGSMVTYLPRDDVRHVLSDNADFRAAIWKLRKDKSSHERSHFLTAVKHLDWEDAASEVRRLTMDMDGSVRREAAAVLRALTGERVELETTPARFRGRSIIENLFEPARELPPKRGWARQSASFTSWLDGTPCLLFGNAAKFRTPGGGAERELVLDRNAHGFLSLGAAAKRTFVILVADGDHGGADYAIGWSDGKAAWEYKPPTLGIRHAAALWDGGALWNGGALWDGGAPYGVVLGVGGKTGLVALDAGGKKLWQLPRRHVVYETRTDPRLPGELLLVAGNCTFVRHERGSAKLALTEFARTPAFAHAHHGILFPDAKGERAAIVAGSSRQGQNLVARFDASGKLVWRAFLSARAGGLAMVEPKKHGRLFVVTTKDGQLRAFDARGVLRAELRLPATKEGEDVATYGLTGGETAPGSWAVAVGLLRGWHLIALRH